MRLLLLALLLEFSFAAAGADAPESKIFDEAHSLNMRLAPSILGSQYNGANAQTSAPSLSDPFSFAYVKILSADPSVDSKISSAKNTSIIWSWGELHESEISQSSHFDARCAQGKTSIVQHSAPRGDFTASFLLENSPLPKRQLHIEDSEYFHFPYSQEELDGAEISAKNSSLPLVLVHINGTISIQYEKREEKNLFACEKMCSKYGCATTCGCKKETLISYPTFSRAVFGEKSFPLENKPARFLVLSPILLEQLATDSRFSIASFSNRIFSKAHFNVSNSLRSAQLLDLELMRDAQFGFAYIKSRERGTSDGNFSFSCAKNATRMFQLTGENSALLYSCACGYNETSPQLGMLGSTLVLYDVFADAYSFSFSSLSRNHTSQMPQGTPLLNNVQYFPGNLTHRPATETTLLAQHRNSDFSSFFQNTWMLLLLSLLLLSLQRFLRQ